jgi:hypothetical protein
MAAIREILEGKQMSQPFNQHRDGTEVIAAQDAFPCSHPDVDDDGFCCTCDREVVRGDGQHCFLVTSRLPANICHICGLSAADSIHVSHVTPEPASEPTVRPSVLAPRTPGQRSALSDARDDSPIAPRGQERALTGNTQVDHFDGGGELGPAWTNAYRGMGMGITATDGQRVPWVNTPTPNVVCPECRKPFEYGHLATAHLKPGEPAIFRHNDCADPTLAKARPPEFWVDQVHDAVGDWEGP